VWLAIRFTLQLWWTSKTRPFFAPSRQYERQSALYRRQANEFTRFAIESGGLIVKVGQFLSVRIDLLPKEYIDVLGALQDALPPVPTASLVAVIESELGRGMDQMYAEFADEPIAAASLGQVHRARLVSGEDVAVKVLRPGVDDLVDVDLRALRSILRLLARLTSIGRYVDVDDLYADFESTFREELDYLQEGHNAEQFQANLLANPNVDIPQIYWDYSSRRVLTMEYMDGVKIDELEQLDSFGVDRKAVATHLLEIYLHMLLQDGFFHADPHPGNVFVRPDGMIQLIDFGMVGTVSDDMRAQFKALIVAVLRKDTDQALSAMRRLGFIRPGADMRRIGQVLMPLIDSMIGDTGGVLNSGAILDSMMRGDGVDALNDALHIDAQALDDMREFILSQPISLPGNTTFLGKALITVVSVCSKLDPDLNLIAVAEPYMKREMGFTTSVWPALAKDGMDLVTAILPTTKHLVSLARKLDEGSLEVSLTDTQGARLERHRDVLAQRLIRTLAGATVMLAGVFVCLLSPQIWLGVVLAAIGAVILLVESWPRHRQS